MNLNFISLVCVLLKYIITLFRKKGIFYFGIRKMSLNFKLLEVWINKILIYRYVFNN